MKSAVVFLAFIIAGGACFGADFDTEVVPLLTKAGCNSGACHGAAAGRGGFHLSLLGADPASDFESIVYAFEGRRVNLVDSGSSLILRKPTGQMAHGGDVVFEEDSSEAQRLKKWIDDGARRVASPALKRLNVTPTKLVLNGTARTTRLQVIAEFENNASVDVTDRTVFHSTDSEAVSISIKDNESLATVHRAGQHVVIARYMNRVQSIQLISPFSSAPLDLSNELRTSFIDDHVLSALSELGIPLSPQASDVEWLRRVTLDLTGRLPTSDLVSEFLTHKTDRDKEIYVDELLASEAFNDYWTLLFSKWLRMHSVGSEMQPLRAYSGWLRDELKQDAGLDKIAYALLTATGDSHVVGPANFSRMVADPRDQAELVGQFFMGRQLGCANCHNHPLDRWTQDDYHGLAAAFAKLERGRNVQVTNRGSVTNLRNGEPAIPRIPGVRNIDVDRDPRIEIAQWITSPDNSHFPKVMVNRLWRAMFGRGLVEPANDLRDTNPASHPELLNQLSDSFVENKYRIRPLLKLMVLSRTYGRSSLLIAGNEADDRFYSRSITRPLMAEVLADAIADVTDVPNKFANRDEHVRAVQMTDAVAPVLELDILGRCAISKRCDESASSKGGLSAQLHLMNGKLINEKLIASRGRLHRMIDGGADDQTIIRDFYLRALGRMPTDLELENWNNKIGSATALLRQQDLEDFVWSMLNSKAFMENH